MIFLSLILVVVFMFLAGVHFNWALGGEWGFDAALPTNEKGERMLNPRKIDSAFVGIGLTLFGLFYLFRADIITTEIPTWIFTFGAWIIPAIFLFRAIGDFKYVGFFKKVRNTKFGKIDTKIFSPLCFFISIIGIVIQLIH